MLTLLAAHAISDSFWRSLRYFNFYRLALAVFLLLVGVQAGGLSSEFAPGNPQLFRYASALYFLACVLSAVALWRVPRHFNWHLNLVVLTDTVVILTIMHASGGLGSGVGVLLLISLAAAGLVGQGRMVLFYASLATLALLFQQAYQGLQSEFEGTAFFRAGLYSIAFFATAIAARLLARRVIVSEELAQQRGVDLGRQLNVTNRVISMLDDGVLVLSPGAKILQANPRARALLGLDLAAKQEFAPLNRVSPELAAGYAAWLGGGPAKTMILRSRPGGNALSARFVPVDVPGGDALIFLQDVGQERELAQRMKLAALGRLTANIAHEIRNPLSAIRHASELLAEEQRDDSGSRLLEIVLDNTQRLDRIVRDVLELGRRDRVERKAIDLAEFLPGFVQQFAAAEKVPPDLIDAGLPAGFIQFDTTHLHQVLWNLLSNAVRYASGATGSIVLRVASADGTSISVADDGPGIAEEQRAQIFEPFVTTNEQGSGLGLFVARELCEANGARLEYQPAAVGACFVLQGDA